MLFIDGNLRDYIDNSPHLSETIRLKLFFNICLAVAHLHSIDVVHRDLKLENVLIDDNNSLKLCDFGSATLNKTYIPKGKQIALAEEDIQANVLKENFRNWLPLLLFTLFNQ